MFGFLKKKKDATPKIVNPALYTVAAGKVVPISEVKDPVFSQKMMGDGYAIIPETGEIHAPIHGKVLSIFPTKHAICLQMDNGLEILLHMGVDTVELNGDPFDIKVTEGQIITPETIVAKVDLAALEKAEKSNEMIVIITNMEALDHFSLSKQGVVQAGEEVGRAIAK